VPKLGERNPGWVDAALDWRGTLFLARLGLTSAYLLGGFTKLFDFAGAVAEQTHFGLSPPRLWAVLAIGVEIVGPILILTGRFVWLGAGAIAVLTAVATFVANDFWNLQGHARFVAMNTFFEHLGLVAGCVLVTLMARRTRRESGQELRRGPAISLARN
jgi:uncharacterized membrane protein YphA (DoxX/SURF4 family)